MGGHPWIVLDTWGILGVSTNWILRHRGLVIGGHPRVVRDTLSILGVRGYSNTGLVMDPWIVQDTSSGIM